MSGFEAAGIILGAYPIILSVLEAYKATRGGKGATSFARCLNTERIIYKEFVYELVAQHASERGLAWSTLENAPKHALWTDITLQKKLKARLGSDKAENVMALLVEIKDILTLIQDELAPVDDGIELLRRFRARLRHVRFNMPQSTLKEQLAKLTALNTQLQRLLAARALPSVSAGRRSRELFNGYLWRGRSHAVDIYNALYASYRCKCNVPHRADFGLPRISSGMGMIRGPEEVSEFELLFSNDNSGEDETDDLSVNTTPDLARSRTQVSTNSGSLNSSRRFSISECIHRNQKTLEDPIPDLCVFTNSCDNKEPKPDGQKGYLTLNEKQFQLRKTTAMHETSLNVAQLDQLLTDQSFLRSRQERISLALNLSYAILSLHSTPWIRSCWMWEDLCVDKENTGQIFVAQIFYSCHNTATSDNKASLTSAFWEIRGEPELTRLGFALIELALGQRLADLRSGFDLKSSDVDTLDYLTAMKLLDSGRIMQAESQKYEDVVKSCLRHQFINDSEVIGLNSSQPSFQANAERCIVEPLHKIVTACWGTA